MRALPDSPGNGTAVIGEDAAAAGEAPPRPRGARPSAAPPRSARRPRAGGSPPGSGGRGRRGGPGPCARLGLARTTWPRWSTASTPSSIAERMASVRPRSRAISAIRRCSSSADWLMMRASSPSSSSRRTRMRAERLPRANWRAVSMISRSDRPSDAERSDGEEPGGDEGQEEGEGPRPPQVAALLLDRPDPAGQARHPHDPTGMAHRHRRVEQLRPHGGAAALGPARLPGERPPHLRPPAVVLDRVEVAPGGRRVGEHAAVGGDDRHPRVHLAGGRVHDRVEGLEADAAGQRVLDHPGHEPRLGGQAGEGLVAGPPVERRAGEEQQHGQGHPGRHHRRHHHAPAQRQSLPHSSPSRARR